MLLFETSTQKIIPDFPNYLITTKGQVINRVTGKILAFSMNNGYCCINLYKNCTLKRFRVHRLVAQAFIENPDNKPQVDHIDRVRTNNHLDNLRWATEAENAINKGGYNYRT